MGGALLLAALAGIAERTGRVPECAGAYAMVVLAAGLLSSAAAIEAVMMNASAAFFGTWGLFALLVRIERNFLVWLAVLLLGLLAMAAIHHFLRVGLLPF